MMDSQKCLAIRSVFSVPLSDRNVTATGETARRGDNAVPDREPFVRCFLSLICGIGLTN